MNKKKFVQGVVAENKHWTDRLYSLKIDAVINPFQPGQFGRLGLDIDGEEVVRPYSFVNAPDDPYLEFYSIVVPGGLLSQRLQTLDSGDSAWVAISPAGFFTLNEVPEGRELWMLSTGTAIGPFLSILKTDSPWQRFKKIVLVHAVRTAEELTYQDTIQKFIARDADKFIMIPFVSREPSDIALPGRIPTAIENGELEKRAKVPLANKSSQVMICGNPNMVRDTTEILKARGMKKNRRREPGNITTENYW